jgi:hypothetical protein
MLERLPQHGELNPPDINRTAEEMELETTITQ